MPLVEFIATPGSQTCSSTQEPVTPKETRLLNKKKRLDTQLTEPRPHSPGSDYSEAGLQGRRLVHLLLQLGVVCDDGVKGLQTLSKVIHLHGVHVRVVVQVGLLERRRLSVRSMRGWAELSEETLQCMVV